MRYEGRLARARAGEVSRVFCIRPYSFSVYPIGGDSKCMRACDTRSAVRSRRVVVGLE